MKKSHGIFAVIALLAALGAGYFWWQHNQQETVLPVASAPPAEPAPASEETPATPVILPPIRHPIEAAPVKDALPTVDDSDSRLAQALQSLVGSDLWRFTFFPERIIRHIVATIDNLPRSEASTKVWPVRPVGSWLQTEGAGNDVRIADANAQRYAQYVELVKRIDVARLGDIYRQFYPLFQRAYVELGYPDGYFNDRLVVAIDDLLAAPELSEPPQLVQNKVLYQYADPELESRSAGQKIMLRIGTGNARIVKEKLRILRAAVTKARPS